MTYVLDEHNRELGPFDDDELETLVASSVLGPTTYVKAGEEDEYMELWKLPPLLNLVQRYQRMHDNHIKSGASFRDEFDLRDTAASGMDGGDDGTDAREGNAEQLEEEAFTRANEVEQTHLSTPHSFCDHLLRGHLVLGLMEADPADPFIPRQRSLVLTAVLLMTTLGVSFSLLEYSPRNEAWMAFPLPTPVANTSWMHPQREELGVAGGAGGAFLCGLMLQILYSRVQPKPSIAVVSYYDEASGKYSLGRQSKAAARKELEHEALTSRTRKLNSQALWLFVAICSLCVVSTPHPAPFPL